MNATTNVQLASLSRREKIGQTCQARLCDLLASAGGPAGLTDYLQSNPVGSLFVGREVIGGAQLDATGMRDLLRRCQAASAVPLSIAGDLENGAGGAVAGLTVFPHLMALGATDSPEQAYEYGKWTAREACEVGFNWVFGPVADLSMNWLNPAVGTRALGDDPERVGKLIASLIRGLQENGLSATAKHFPGDGVDFRDQHLCRSVNALGEEAWLNSFGTVYAACLDAGVHSVMAGHIGLPWCDSATDPQGGAIPATVSRALLTGLLRGRLGFHGLVVSDALIMAGYTSWAPYEERMIQAFTAGVDVMLWPGDSYFDLMEQALEDGRITDAQLDQSVGRILRFKQRQGLFDNSPQPDDWAGHPVKRCEEAATFAGQLASRSLTLARNRIGVLPLDSQHVKRVLILAAAAHPDRAAQTLQPLVRSLEERGIEVTLHVNGNCLDVAAMEEVGRAFDAFICTFDQSMHALKNTLRPIGAMAECIWTLQNTETLSPIIVSLGSPYLLNDMPFADTMINAYSPAEATVQALGDALFGESHWAGSSPVDVGGEWLTQTEGMT